MKIKIAIVVLCWLVLFASAQQIEDKSIQKMLERNSLSINSMADSVKQMGSDFVSDFISDSIPENSSPNSIEGGIGSQKNNCLISSNPDQLDTDGDGVGDVCDKCLYENATGFDENEDGCIDNKDE